jgi:hypothetical protein
MNAFVDHAAFIRVNSRTNLVQLRGSFIIGHSFLKIDFRGKPARTRLLQNFRFARAYSGSVLGTAITLVMSQGLGLQKPARPAWYQTGGFLKKTGPSLKTGTLPRVLPSGRDRAMFSHRS